MATVIDVGITENQLLDSLVAELRRPENTRRPGDFTREELQKASGRSKDKVLEILRAKMAAGEIKRVRVIDNGISRPVYRAV